MRKRSYDVVVIGAGPAGLLAAGRAALLGARVLLLEKMEKPARKLRITGKGRCNLANTRALEEQLLEIHPEPRFLRQAFAAFFSGELLDLLRQNGVETKVERGGRVFPDSDRAWDVAEALVAWTRGQGVEIRKHAQVRGLLIEDRVFQGVEVESETPGSPQRIHAACGIVATGGCSYPATGSTGDGHRWAERTGHHLTPLRPSLVGIATVPVFKSAQGLKLKHVQLTLWVDGKKQGSEFGEAEFTEYGLDGPIVLRLSRKIVDGQAAGRQVELTLDLKPALETQQLEARLIRDLDARAKEPCQMFLRSLLPTQLVEVFVRELGLDRNGPATQLAGAKRKPLLGLLKELRFRATGHRGWEEAIVTAGGVALRDVDPRTMASRRIEGLYFAGEVLDLDANTGGYNLQIAFSTGWLAGEAAARRSLHLTQAPLEQP